MQLRACSINKPRYEHTRIRTSQGPDHSMVNHHSKISPRAFMVDSMGLHKLMTFAQNIEHITTSQNQNCDARNIRGKPSPLVGVHIFEQKLRKLPVMDALPLIGRGPLGALGSLEYAYRCYSYNAVSHRL